MKRERLTGLLEKFGYELAFEIDGVLVFRSTEHGRMVFVPNDRILNDHTAGNILREAVR